MSFQDILFVDDPGVAAPKYPELGPSLIEKQRPPLYDQRSRAESFVPVLVEI